MYNNLCYVVFWLDPDNGEMSVSVASGELIIFFPEEVHEEYS